MDNAVGDASQKRSIGARAASRTGSVGALVRWRTNAPRASSISSAISEAGAVASAYEIATPAGGFAACGSSLGNGVL